MTALGARPGERILDLGCGSGASTIALADSVRPGGHVTGIDVSPDLLSDARARADGRNDVTLIEADAERYAFPVAQTDALYSRFGSMFFDNPPHAFRNLHRALRPGARAVFVAWREPARNQWASVPSTFAAEGMISPGAPSGPGPFAWEDPGTFRPLLGDAGFRIVAEHTHEFMAEIADGDDPDPVERAIAFMMRIGPMASRLKGAPEEAKVEAEAFLRRRLPRHVQGGVVRLLASAWIIEAQV